MTVNVIGSAPGAGGLIPVSGVIPAGDYESVVLAEPAIVAFWPLSEPSGTSATDLVGSHTATYVGAAVPGGTSLVAGYTAATFPGASSAYVLASSAFIAGGQAAWTIKAWIETVSSARQSIYSERAASGNDILQLQLASGGTTRLVFRDDAGHIIQTTGIKKINDGRPHQVSVTKTGSTWTTYIDGYLDATGSVGSVTDNFTNASSPQVQIGGDAQDATEPFIGTIGMVAVCQAALSASQILVDYQSRVAKQVVFNTQPGNTAAQQALTGSDIVVLNEKVWLQDPSGTGTADNTGTVNATSVLNAALAKAATAWNHGQGGLGLVAGAPGQYKVDGSIAIPAGVVLGGFGGGVSGSAILHWPVDTGYPTVTGTINGATSANPSSLPVNNVTGGPFNPAGGPFYVGSFGLCNYTGVTGSGSSVTLTGVTGLTSATGGGNLIVANSALMCGGGPGRRGPTDQTISLSGPASATSGWASPTRPTNAMDGIWIPGSTRIELGFSGGFRHCILHSGDHETFAANMQITGCYSAVSYEVPAVSGGWGGVDSGNQTFEGNIVMVGNRWCSIYTTTGAGYLAFKIGANCHMGEQPCGIWAQSGGGTMIDGNWDSPVFESLGVCAIGGGGTGAQIAEVNFTGWGVSWNGTYTPAGYSGPIAEIIGDVFECNWYGTNEGDMAGVTTASQPVVIGNTWTGYTDTFQPGSVHGRTGPLMQNATASQSSKASFKFRGGAIVNLFESSFGAASIVKGNLVMVHATETGQGLFNAFSYDLHSGVATIPVAGVATQDSGPGGTFPMATGPDAGAVTVLNKTGATIAAGDLLKADSAHAGGVTTSTGFSDGPVVGRALASIAGGASGLCYLVSLG